MIQIVVLPQNGVIFYQVNKSSDKRLPAYIRNHWSIENKLHWVLDVHMKEDNDQKSERKSVRSLLY